MSKDSLVFRLATKGASKIKMAIIGPAGSGKTYSGLIIASGLGARIALIDSEHGSASKYADLVDFDTVDLGQHHPQTYIDLIKMAEAGGYDVLVIDSLSHAWDGVGGALELVDAAAAKSRAGNTFAAWKDVTPIQRRLVDTILASKMHIICTMRAKTEYVIESINGKNIPRKIGTGPVQRQGVEYEFDIVGEIDQAHIMTITKTRIPGLDSYHDVPGPSFVDALKKWLGSSSTKKTRPVITEKPKLVPPLAPRKEVALKNAITEKLVSLGVPTDEIRTRAPRIIEILGGKLDEADAILEAYIGEGDRRWNPEKEEFEIQREGGK